MQVLRIINAGRNKRVIGFRNETEILRTLQDIQDDVDVRHGDLDDLFDQLNLVTAAKKDAPRRSKKDQQVRTVIIDKRGKGGGRGDSVGDFTVKFSMNDLKSLNRNYASLVAISMQERTLNDIAAYDIQNPLERDTLKWMNDLRGELERQRADILSLLKRVASQRVPAEFKKFTVALRKHIVAEFEGVFTVNTPDVTVDLPFDHRHEDKLPEGYDSVIRFKQYQTLESLDPNGANFVLTVTNIVGLDIFEIRVDATPGSKFKEPTKMKDTRAIGAKLTVDGEAITFKPRAQIPKLIDHAVDVMVTELQRSRVSFHDVSIGPEGIVLDRANFAKSLFPPEVTKIDIDDGTMGSEAAIEVVISRGGLEDGAVPFSVLGRIIQVIYSGVVEDYKDVEIVTIHKSKQRLRFEFVEGGHGVYLDPAIRRVAEDILEDDLQRSELYKFLRQHNIGVKGR